jgi:hypothetical protein
MATTWQCDTHHPHKQTIGYGQYFGAKDGFTLVLGAYLVWPLRLPLVWMQLPTTKSEPALDFWNWNPNPGLKLDLVPEQKLEPRPGSRTGTRFLIGPDTRSGTGTRTQF